MMKFSVLMSIYNKEQPEYFELSLESVMNQTLLPQEVIIVEDGLLTEALYNIINNYKMKYPNIIKTYRIPQNMGLGNALKEGIKRCEYDIIMRMDTDDICENERFEKQIRVFKENKDIDVVGSNIMEYNENMQKILQRRKVPETTEEIKKAIKRKNPFNHMTVAYKKSAVLNAGNYEDVPYFEDYFLWCKLYLANCKFFNIQEDLVKVRTGDSMIKRRGGIKYIISIFNFQKRIIQLKVINVYEYITNIIIRVSLSLVPNKLRKKFYYSFLREEK